VNSCDVSALDAGADATLLVAEVADDAGAELVVALLVVALFVDAAGVLAAGLAGALAAGFAGALGAGAAAGFVGVETVDVSIPAQRGIK
jgi:hypothetical protein